MLAVRSVRWTRMAQARGRVDRHEVLMWSREANSAWQGRLAP